VQLLLENGADVSIVDEVCRKHINSLAVLIDIVDYISQHEQLFIMPVQKVMSNV
jgi:hypothetical protein